MWLVAGESNEEKVSELTPPGHNLKLVPGKPPLVQSKNTHPRLKDATE
jgi:hypothetical protein